jgi:transposase-like protein
VITVDLEPLPDTSAVALPLPLKKDWNCLSCQFVGDSEKLLEEHVVAKHADENTKSGNKICLECGFKATPKQSLVNHQKKTKHTKTNEVATTADDGESEGSVSTLTEVESTPQVQQAKKGRTKTPNPYRCKHCKFSAVNEHGINLHWQRIHLANDLPLDFECDISPEVTAAKPESAKIYYKCQLCSVQPGLYEEMRLHSKTLHPNCPVKIFRITSKVKGNQQKEPSVTDSKDLGTPPVKITRVEKAPTASKEAVAATSSTFAVKSQPKHAAKTTAPSTSGSSQTVFVVAPPANQPAYACAWCNSKFQQESQVIKNNFLYFWFLELYIQCQYS